MGTGKGKKAKLQKSILEKKKIKEAKAASLPKPSLDHEALAAKAAKKEAKREERMQKILAQLGSSTDSHTMKNALHAKWPALFKQHIGLIEFHIKRLERLMQSMKAEMDGFPEKQRLEWELGERGNWRVMCEMMDRARELYVNAKVAAKGILPDERLRDKKGMGVVGGVFEPLGPQLAARAAEMGYTKRGKLGRNPDDPESESDSDSEDDENVDPVAEGGDFISLNGKSASKPSIVADKGNEQGEASSTKQQLGEGIKKKSEKTTTALTVEANEFFFVDTEPAPVDLNAPVKEGKGAKKRRLAAERAGKKAAREARKMLTGSGLAGDKLAKGKGKLATSTAAPEPEPASATQSEPDFKAIEKQLQSEIEAETKAREAERADEESTEVTEEVKSKKKRRRSSDGYTEAEEREIKKDKKDKDRKRKAEDSLEQNEQDKQEVEVVPKKPKKEKEKKRKAEDIVEEADEGVVVKKYKSKEKKDKKRKAEDEDSEGERKKKKSVIAPVVEGEEEEL